MFQKFENSAVFLMENPSMILISLFYIQKEKIHEEDSRIY